MSASELAEHAGYLADTVKLAAYEQALRALLEEGDRSVLDLGAGTGVLGLLAARAGASVVYSVDSGPVLGPAAQAAARSGYGERIVHIRGRSTEIDLPEPADIAVCDQIGGFVHDAGVLEYFADARHRLLAPDSVLVPAGFRMFLAPAECPTVREEIDVWRSSPGGFDFSVFHELAVNTEHQANDDQIRLLGPGVQVAQIAADHIDAIKGGGTTIVEGEGRCDGLVGWFDAAMGGGVSLTNQPGDPGRMRRWCNVYPIASGVDVHSGDTVEFNVDVRPMLKAVTWQVSIVGPERLSKCEERHSTLLGQFLAADDLARSGGATVTATSVGRALARALELADGTRSTDEVMEQVRVENLVGSDQPSVEETMRRTLERFTTPLARRPSG